MCCLIRQAAVLVGDMAVDQFGLVRCSDILRVMKMWVETRRREKPEALWEIVSNYVVEGVKSTEKCMKDALAVFVNRAMKTGSTARPRATVAKECLRESLQNVSQNLDTDDDELQWNLSIRIGENALPIQGPTNSPISKYVGVSRGDKIRFRLGIHSPSSTDGDVGVKGNKNKLRKEGPLDYDSDDSQLEEVDQEMRLIVNFSLSPEITGKVHNLSFT